MKKSYKDAINVSDEKLKRIVMEMFEQKFFFLSKKDYLRWINERITCERLKDLTVEMMNEEDLKEEPTAAGFYNEESKKVKYNPEYISKKYAAHVLEHEFNHFLNGKVEQFPRYIDEGITEFLTNNSLEFNSKTIPYVSYEQNVHLVELLYDVFKDELIKCYLSGVTSDFEKKFSEYFNGELHLFYEILEKIHDVIYSSDKIKNPNKYNQDIKKITDTVIPKYKEFLITFIENSIKMDMLDFKYYSNSKINFNILNETISSRFNYINKILPKSINSNEIINAYKRIYLTALSNSYLINYFSKDEIKNIINKNICLKDNKCYINLSEISMMLDNKTNDRENMYYAASMKLNTNNYNENGLDISSFLLDFYTLFNSGKYEKSPVVQQQSLYSLLFKTLKSNVNIDIINNIISKYGELFFNMANLRTQNKKTTSDSIFFDVSPNFFGQKKYIEKKDNEFYFIGYDLKDNSFSRKGMGFWHYSYNKEFPKEIEFIEQGKSNQIYRLMFDKYFEKALYNGKILNPIELLNDNISSELANSIDYNKYKIKQSNGDANTYNVDGVYLVPDPHMLPRYIFDFELLFKDLIDLRFLKNSLITDTVNKIIDIAIKRTFQIKNVPDNIKNILFRNAYNYILNNETSKIEIEKCIVELCNLEKEYIDGQEKTGAYYFKNEESHKKFTEVSKVKENQERKFNEIRNINIEAKKYANDNFQMFIIDRYDKILSTKQFDFGIKNIKFNGTFEYHTPSAKRINFELLIDSLRQIFLEDKDNQYKKNCYIDCIIDKLLGYAYNINNISFDKIEEKKQELCEIILNILSSSSKYDVNLLNGIADEIVKLFEESYEFAYGYIKNRKLKNNKNCNLYNQILKIYENKEISEEEKEIRINTIVNIMNEQEGNEELMFIDKLINDNRTTNKQKSK